MKCLLWVIFLAYQIHSEHKQILFWLHVSYTILTLCLYLMLIKKKKRKKSGIVYGVSSWDFYNFVGVSFNKMLK